MNIYQDIAQKSKSLMIKEPFYGLFLLGLNKEVSDINCDTACVFKKDINTYLRISPTFWEELGTDDATKKGVLKHELLHIAFFHLLNSKTYPDSTLFNIAADLEVNQYIEPSL